MTRVRKGAAAWRIHPGEILREEFLKPMKITPHRLAKALRVSPPTVNDLVLKRRGITPEMATRLARALGTSEQFWLNLQGAYDVSRITEEKADDLGRIQPLRHVVV